MEHCKKLVLVPQETVARIHEKPAIRTSGDVLSDLDSQMQQILQQNVEDSKKWKLYEQALQRYLFFVNEQRKPLTLLVPGNEKTVTDTPSSDNVSLRDKLLALVPPKFKKSASFLYDHLNTAKGKELITWDDDGVASVNGRTSSSIIDFIADTVRPRKTAKARDWRTFASVLKSMHTPLEIIGNTEYRQAIESQDGAGIQTYHGTEVEKTSTNFAQVPARQSKITRKHRVGRTKWRTWY